jgi:uncharacterized membrane protein YkvA (DUF1232 family)
MARFLSGVANIVKLMFDKEVSFKRKLLFLVPVAYLLFPLDIIGDFIPLAGQLDDVAVFVFMWPILKNVLAKYKQGHHQNKNDKFSKDKDGKTIDMNKDDYDFE